jgi:aspartate aminotransferase
MRHAVVSFSEKSASLQGQKMFQILDKARQLELQGKEVFHFEIGDPYFDTPKNVVEAAVGALRAGNTHYVSSSGLDSFRKVAAEMTHRSRGFKPDSAQILVTQGANVQLFYSFACTLNAGDEVILPDPCFVSYTSILEFLGVVPVRIPLSKEDGFRISPDAVEKAITPKTKMILVNSPHNPTGAVLGEQTLRRLFEIAEQNDLWFLSDEVYGRLVFDDNESPFFSPSVIDECKVRTILVHSFSKSYAMTGWRIGAVTAPKELIRRMGLLLETTTSCVSPFIQVAATEAMRSSQTSSSHQVAELRRSRDFMVAALNGINGIECPTPEGAFYAFADVRGTGMTDVEFCDFVLENAGIAVVPGSFFGPSGRGFVRFCFAVEPSSIEKGLGRLESLLGSRLV